MIGVVNYGLGNIMSIMNMLRRIGVEAAVCDDPGAIERADRLILPGVGAFDAGMKMLNGSGMRPSLEAQVAAGTPVLGICLGMQFLGRKSEEGTEPGLGWVAADTVRLRAADDLPLPHMGWNWIEPKGPSALFDPDDAPLRFYFLHSFVVACDDESTALATFDYGGEFVGALADGNIFGVQFHPEKSHRFGMKVLERFTRADL